MLMNLRLMKSHHAICVTAVLLAGVFGINEIACAADIAGITESANWKPTKYPGNTRVSPVKNAMGDNPGIRLECGLTKIRKSFISMSHIFNRPVNMSGLRVISFFAKGNAPAQPSLYLDCEGGQFKWTFSRQRLKGGYQIFKFHRSQGTKRNTPDLSKVKRIAVGFGLWGFDTTKTPFSVTISKIRYEGTETGYIIPKPTRGVTIEGAYKDWGFEDTLYNWFPPEYIHLSNEEYVFPGKKKWRGPLQLSGRFALMLDDKNLYFLGLVVDETPFQGNNIKPWLNDSIELFLAFNMVEQTFRLGRSMREKGVQIIFDCGADSGRTGIHINGKPLSVPLERKTIPKTWLISGRQVKGYVTETAIPLSVFPVKKLVPGTIVGYSVKLNDSSGLHLIATPDNLSPNANCRGFRKAYIEFMAKTQTNIKFGPTARNATWPARYADGERDVHIWDMTKAHRKNISSTIKRVYLNSLWAVQPAVSNDKGPDPAKWLYAPVPMGIGWFTPVFIQKSKGGDALTGGKHSRGLYNSKLKQTFFWYERTFTVDPDMTGGELLLVFEYLTEEAQVYLNQKLIGIVNLARRSLNLTNLVKHGQKNRLSILLYRKWFPGYSSRNGRGLNGDIYLEHHKHTPAVRDVWVKNASGMNGSFEIVVETDLPKNEIARLTLDILADNGEVMTTAEGRTAGQAPTTLTGICNGFKPWSPETPNLFTLKIRCLKDNILLDERIRRFGFRTFEIRNARFMLNGRIIRLRTAHLVNKSAVLEPGRLRELKHFGHNTIFFHAIHYKYNTPIFEKLDEIGMLAFAPTDRSWPDAQTVAEIRRQRNHPCVIGYVSDSFGQLSVNGFIHNPFAAVDDEYYPTSREARQIYKVLRRRNDLFKSVDPTRPYYPQATGNFAGAFRSENRYPTYDLNLTDRMLWYVPWSRRKKPILPNYLIEAGTSQSPYMDTTHPKHKMPVCGDRMVRRKLFYECGARYLGTRVFDNWREWDLMLMKAHFRSFRICGIDGFTPWVKQTVFLDPVNLTKAQSIKDNRRLSYRYFTLPYKDTLEDSWMRMNSWYYRLRALACWQWPKKYGQGKLKRGVNEYTSLYEHEMQPFFACIGGHARNLFSQEHNYFAGESIEKQLVVVNDTMNAVEVSFNIIFSVGNHVEKKKLKVAVPQGGIEKRVFSFAAPKPTTKTTGKLRLDYVNPAGEAKSDEFAVTVFPAVAPDDAIRRPWIRQDWPQRVGMATAPDGASILAKAGLTARQVSLAKAIPDNLDLLVIERGALTKQTDAAALKAYIDQGGNVLIMEQTEKGLLDWNLRERRLEAVFIADKDHPVVKGLDNRDLAFFRGKSGTVPSERRPSEHFRHDLSVRLETPHLSSEGLVASCVFHKPAYGRIRPILVGGFDLEESGVIEIRSGKGRAIFCQVDVTERYGVDPAATLLADNLLNYMLTSKPKPAVKVAYAGGDQGEMLLDRLGIVHAAPEDVTEKNILVLGDGIVNTEELLARGWKTVVALPCCTNLPAGVTTKAVRIQKMDRPHYWNGSTSQFEALKSPCPAPDRLQGRVGETFRGLVDNDAYFFESPRLKAYVTAGAITLEWKSRYGTMFQGRMGRTRLVLYAVDPFVLKHAECRRKALRTWSVIFNNLCAESDISLCFAMPECDISLGRWTFLTDPDGTGEKRGYQNGEFGNRRPRSIVVGEIWEDQGVTEKNPNVQYADDSDYDGFAWYFRTVKIPEKLRGREVYFHVDGVREVATYGSGHNTTVLWVNGVKMPMPIGINSGYRGGVGARLWKLPANALKPGEDNLIAIRIYNDKGAGGIHRKPVRFETRGRNNGILLPYEFILSKHNPYFFWSW